jgi:hypothetical protein
LDESNSKYCSKALLFRTFAREIDKTVECSSTVGVELIAVTVYQGFLLASLAYFFCEDTAYAKTSFSSVERARFLS